MKLQQRINAFIQLGEILKDKQIINKAKTYLGSNEWFKEEDIIYAILAISQNLTLENIEKWLSPYQLIEKTKPKKVCVVMAGNIPLVGFHEFLCVLLSGNIFIGKTSSKDNKLLLELANILIALAPDFKTFIHFTEDRLTDFDAIIATGSNNTARYFEYYFGKYPHIIRKNRNTVAILDGTETKKELHHLGKDIFLYFGLGCRSVSKLFVPENYDFTQLFDALFDYKEILLHNKYANNYTYQKTICLMNSEKILDNGFFLLKEDVGLSSPVGLLHYEYYTNKQQLDERLMMDKANIQCIVSKYHIPFGQTQQPKLWDYADDVDTMRFLLGNCYQK